MTGKMLGKEKQDKFNNSNNCHFRSRSLCASCALHTVPFQVTRLYLGRVDK